MDYHSFPGLATGVILPVHPHAPALQTVNVRQHLVLHLCAQNHCHRWWTCCSQPLMSPGMQATVTDTEPQDSEAPQPQHQPPAYQAESTGPSGAGETLHDQVPSPPHPSTSQQSAPNPLVCTRPHAQRVAAASSLLDYFHYSIVTIANCDSYLLQDRRSHLCVCACRSGWG